MGIKHFKGSEHSPEAKSAVEVAEGLIATVFDRELQADAGTHRLLPVVYVVAKGKPYIYTTLGPTVVYVIEGEYVVEDQSTGSPISLTKGDVILFDEGITVKCSSPSNARAFGATYIAAPQVITDGLVKESGVIA